MPTTTREYFQGFGKDHLPGLLGVEIVTVSREAVESRMGVQKKVMAPTCGYGCIATLPEGASGFTTIELKANFVGTAREGAKRAARRSRCFAARRWSCGPSRQLDTNHA